MSLAARMPELYAAHVELQQCASQCAKRGVSVAAADPNAAELAVGTLKRCGVVQLENAFDPELLDRVQRGIDSLYGQTKSYTKLLDQEQLHDGRHQVYLPFASPFKSRQALGISDLVFSVLSEYFQDMKFGIDHVSVLTSSSGSGNQTLHPDVPYFKGLTVSVHTALRDITMDMGPTYFCPCTGEALERSEWPASAAIKMSILKRKECIASSFVPSLTRRGTITIYDGAMFHKGLANGSDKDRPVLKLEVGAESFPDIRNYIQRAPAAAKKQTKLFRDAFGPPRMG